MTRQGLRIDVEDVWLYYHHIENMKKLGLGKGDYCARYGLDPNKFGNMKYAILYCKEGSRARYDRMIKLIDEFDMVDADVTIAEFCRKHRLKKSDFYTAQRHREFTWLILKRIAEGHPPPELLEAGVDINLADPKLANQVIAITDDLRIEHPPVVDPETLDEPTLFDDFEHLATDDPPETPVFIDEPEDIGKLTLSLSDFISKRKLSEPTPEVHFDEADEFDRLSREYDEPSEEEEQVPAKRGRKPKVLESEDISDPKEPMKFFALNSPIPLDHPKEGEQAQILPAEPEVQLKGNRIELTFTKTVRLTAAPDTPHDKLLSIINLLKDL